MPRWFESSSRYMDDHYDARKELNNPTARRMMRQFLNHDGPKGNKPEYDRGYEYTFRFSQNDRDIVNAMMNKGMSFAEAFDTYKASLEAMKGPK